MYLNLFSGIVWGPGKHFSWIIVKVNKSYSLEWWKFLNGGKEANVWDLQVPYISLSVTQGELV